MKLAIKIFLLVLVVAGIGTAAYFMFRPMKESGDELEMHKVTKFEKHIQERVEDEITDKDFDEATEGYQSILDEIDTEAAVLLDDDEENLSAKEERNCRKEAFFAYAPIFTNHAQSYFRKASWDEDYIDSLQHMAQRLLATDIAESGTDVDGKLKSTIETVNDYHEAWRLVNSAGGCSSLSAVDNAISRSNAFRQRSPLSNNTDLVTALTAVPEKAKDAYAGYIIRRCENIAANYYNYDSYVAFYTALDGANKLINEFTNKYGQEYRFSNAKAKLANADRNALNAYD